MINGKIIFPNVLLLQKSLLISWELFRPKWPYLIQKLPRDRYIIRLWEAARRYIFLGSYLEAGLSPIVYDQSQCIEAVLTFGLGINALYIHMSRDFPIYMAMHHVCLRGLLNS